mmetsp:Transcript_15040/g.38242  ORF Transcript_15040/g.38242 Transcript_15040/m.38242 type:complete len:290 (+) Transcript_15040:2275-3144(+)
MPAPTKLLSSMLSEPSRTIFFMPITEDKFGLSKIPICPVTATRPSKPSNVESLLLLETIKFPPTLAKLCNPSNISSSKLFEISRSPSTTVRFCKPSNAVRPVSKIFKLPCTSLSPANAFRSVTFPPATTRLPGNTPPASAAVSAAACKVALSRSSPFRRRASSIGTREYSATHPPQREVPPLMKRTSAADQGRATTSPVRLPESPLTQNLFPVESYSVIPSVGMKAASSLTVSKGWYCPVWPDCCPSTSKCVKLSKSTGSRPEAGPAPSSAAVETFGRRRIVQSTKKLG